MQTMVRQFTSTTLAYTLENRQMDTRVVVYQHEEMEGLGLLEPVLQAAGLELVVRLRAADIAADERAALVVAMGGPMAVYEADRFPFLSQELEVMRRRLRA